MFEELDIDYEELYFLRFWNCTKMSVSLLCANLNASISREKACPAFLHSKRLRSIIFRVDNFVRVSAVVWASTVLGCALSVPSRTFYGPSVCFGCSLISFCISSDDKVAKKSKLSCREAKSLTFNADKIYVDFH